MINKFSNISSNVSKIVEEGVEFALLINYNNMYDYDYILKNVIFNEPKKEKEIFKLLVRYNISTNN